MAGLGRIFAVFGAFLLLGWSVNAYALTPEEAASRLFSAETIERNWFASQGLASAAPPVIAEIKESLGRFRAVGPCSEKCVALFTGGEVSFTIAIDGEGLVSGLLIDLPIVYAASLDDAVAQFAELPGGFSVFVSRNDEVLHDIDGSTPMAVGSSFKLAVLKALNNLIGAGKLDWDQVVSFDEAWRSLPSGRLQDWPEAAPFTLYTLAGLMISESDNTATDALIDIVTRNSVETISPRNRPFLTTRELFQFKHRDHETMRTRYAAGNFDQRMEILNGFSTLPLPRISQLNTDPMLAFGWFFSTRELCSLMSDLQSLEVLQINPGLARQSDWRTVSYKGGSDYGVLNMTTGLVDVNGNRYCVSVTWNSDEMLDEETFFGLYASALQALKPPM